MSEFSRTISRRATLGGIGAGLAWGLSSVHVRAQAGPNILKLGTQTLNDSQHEWMKIFARLVEADTKGQIKVELYPASQLGTAPRMIEGTQFDDRFEGGPGFDTFLGLDGDDQFQPTAVYEGPNAGDFFSGGLGNDRVFIGSYASAGVTGDFATGVFTVAGEPASTYIGIESLTGSNFADTIFGDEEANVIDGYYGGDTIDGRGGDDEIFGTELRDVLHGGVGNDQVIGFGGNDDLFGDDGDDSLDARDGDDLLNGGAGTNTLDGGPGTDTCLLYMTAVACEVFP